MAEPTPDLGDSTVSPDLTLHPATNPLPSTTGPSEGLPQTQPETDVQEGDGQLTAQNMELLHEQEMAMAEHDGTQMLRNVFDSMANNGKITMDQLPFVLVGAEVQATAKEIDDAIEEHVPDADDADALLDFDQVLALYQQLLRNVAEAQPLERVTDVEPQQVPLWWVRAWQWWKAFRHARRGKSTAYEKHMKPTTRLLLLILFVSCLISAAVVAFAVAFIWLQSMNTVAQHVQRDAQLLKDGLNLFGYTHPLENYDTNMGQLASLLGVVVDQLGYQSTRTSLLANLQYQQGLLSSLLDGWFQHDSLNTVNTTVMLTSAWAERMLQNMTVSDLVDVVNGINPNLPNGHEILLARWSNASRTSIDFLTTHRYANQCIGECGSSGSTATHKALAGQTGALFGVDYRPMPVAAGYTWLASVEVAMVYNIMLYILREEFVSPVTSVVDQVNEQTASANMATNSSTGLRQNSQEIVIANQLDGATTITSSLRNCDAECLQRNHLNNSLIAAAVRGYTGVNETADYDGEQVLAAFGPLPVSALGMEVKIAREEFIDNLYQGLGTSLNTVNSLLTGTEEVQFVTHATGNGSSAIGGLQFWTAFRFPEDCPSEGCGTLSNTSNFLKLALNSGTSGVMHSLDYRDAMVSAGYAPIPSLGAALAVKVDFQQILSEGRAMAGTIATYENNVRYAHSSTEVVVAQKKPGVAVAQSARDFIRITVLKFRSECPNMTCVGESVQITAAVNGQTGYEIGPDYRNAPTVGAYTYIPSLDVGLVVKIDEAEAEHPSMILALELLGCAVAAVLCSMLMLAYLANVLLKSMDRAWDEGKRAIEREKQAFRSVVEAMYPAQVAKRLLAGETQIVYNVPLATVFFSDIYEFTTTSNAVTPEELIQFMGYTFGTMDTIAEYHHIYKVKTIGDAYLAVSGLPGSESFNGNSTLDMMMFANCCVQIFSTRFLHPDEGAILDSIVKNVIVKKKLGGKPAGAAPLAQEIPKRPSLIMYSNPTKDMPAGDDDPAAPQVHCIMRYGVAAGPITAGVLQGKTPLFDIWGKTVNLASRMESTGQPGRVQVSELVYQTVVALKGQPFTFETRHKVFCKGFGNVSAYFLDTSAAAPPKELLTTLRIEPNLGHFFFDNPVPTFKMAAKAQGPKSGSHHDSHSDQQSSHCSSSVSGRKIRADADLM